MKKIFTIAITLLFTSPLFGQNFYGGLDQWRTVSVFTAPGAGLEAPQGWFTADSLVHLAKLFYPDASFKKQVYKTTDKHGGSHAAQLITIAQDSLGTVPGILSNARIDFDMQNFDPNDPLSSLSYTGGTFVNQRISDISAWLKYEPRGNDTASVLVRAVLDGQGVGGTDSIVGSGDVFIGGAVGSYTKYTIPITYINGSVVPDKMLILFRSSGLGNGQDSSMLWVDDISAASLGLEIPFCYTSDITLYPNPVRDLLHINVAPGEGLVFRAYDLNGRMILEKKFEGQSSIDVSAVAAGFYLYQVSTQAGAGLQQGKFEVAR